MSECKQADIFISLKNKRAIIRREMKNIERPTNKTNFGYYELNSEQCIDRG